MNNRNKKSGLGFSTLELLIIAVIVCLLAGVIITKFSAVRQSTRDEQRKTDITLLQDAVETYQAENGRFPTVAQLNSDSFRKINMKDLAAGALQDPKWSAKNKSCVKNGEVQVVDSANPPNGCYGYSALPPDCNATDVQCTDYVLIANLEAGSTYVKKSMD